VRPDDVLVVGGLQQGLDLIARVLLAPGDCVAVEAPTYGNALAIWRLYGARPVGIPLDDGGLVPEAFARIVRQHRPKIVYTMPTFQNPTGITMDEARRREIMRIAADAGVGIVEDHFDSELRYRGRALPPLRAHDTRGQVVLLGTFSKILFPGFRLGWLVAPRELLDRLLDVKRATELATSLPIQMAVAEFCAQGELDRHLERVCLAHGARLEAMLEAIDASFPPEVHVTRPEGGMTVWVTLPEGARSSAVAEAAARKGVLVAEGRWFMPDGDGERNVRLSFVTEPAERIRRGIEVLGAVIGEHLADTRPAGRGSDESAPFL
jgi:2-aminoadipate transaminase